jgi:hypothetical protein
VTEAVEPAGESATDHAGAENSDVHGSSSREQTE